MLVSELSNFDTAGFGLVDGSVGEGDDDLTAAVGSGGELFDEGLVGSCGSVDIEVGEHGGAVDGDVKLALAGSGEVGFGEVEQHGVLAAGGQAGDGVGEGPGALRLIDSHRRSIGDAGHDDGVAGGVGASTGEVLVSGKGVVASDGVADRGPPGVDGDEVGRGCRVSCGGGLVGGC